MKNIQDFILLILAKTETGLTTLFSCLLYAAALFCMQRFCFIQSWISLADISVVYEKSFTLLIMTLHLHHTIDIFVSYTKVSDCHPNNVHYVECSDM